MGTALSLDIARRDGSPDGELARRIVEEALIGDLNVVGEHMGLVLTAGGPNGNMIMLAPSLSMSESSLALLEGLLRAVFARVSTFGRS
jgi:4-aminobutyrate aminotransferase-like enzyme